ncbi:MAG: GtrA family protein [Anaerolineae bacterium]|nr:GtrA family protein [Anaerolineae bacterium]
MAFFTVRLNGFLGTRGRREFERFLRFAVVGTWGFVVDFSVLNFLIFVVHVPAWLANTCSFTIAVLNTFTLNRIWTMPESRQRPVNTQLAQFFLVNLGGYAINELIFLASHALVWQHFCPDALAWNLAKATASGIALFWNFGANRLWTWRGL